MTDPKPSAEFKWDRAYDVAEQVVDRLHMSEEAPFRTMNVASVQRALSAAVSEAVESTVREAAKELCGHCADGEPVSLDDGMWLHRAGTLTCWADAMWLRWPALAPKEEK